ncbi:hypothetical protein O181_048632 [Austropuccinia psidii MF-1]|uniref:Uncharacterized protein n=1 Tax=Austropuccinia psidii MF-1 TaxID=1389203 RepID=A0A9Q3HLT6_9BASI|nr:hypothetical protein [Austropuccinia psidii MF-1]
MVHTRYGSNYSIQPDGCGQGRGKTRGRSGKSSSRNTCLQDSIVFPHYPRSIPTNFDVNSTPELIEGSILRAEPFPSYSIKNISVPIQKTGSKKQKKRVQYTDKKEESDQDSAVFNETLVEDYSIEKITNFFEVTEINTHLPQYSENFYGLINIQDSRMCKSETARGKGYISGASCITSVLINDVEAQVNLDPGRFYTCIGKDYLEFILPEWKKHMLPIKCVQFSSASHIVYSLGILDTSIVSPYPAGSVRMKTEIVVMENFTSQHIILGNDYLNIYGIDINNHKDGYFTIGENKRQKFAFYNIPKQITIEYSNKDTYKEEFVTDKLVEGHSIPSLSPKMRKELINVLYTHKHSFAFDEPLGTMKGNELDIHFNIDRKYDPVLRRPAYPASSRAKEAL